MRIAILTLGSRGDVQPYLALAKALRVRGHGVRLYAPDNFEAWVTGHGVPFHGLGLDIQAFLQDPGVRAALTGNVLKIGKIWRTHIRAMMETTLAAVAQAGRQSDVIVYHPKIQAVADVVEAFGVRPVVASPVPMMPTGDFPPIVFTKTFGRAVNRRLYGLFSLARFFYKDMIDAWRRDTLGLAKGPFLMPIGTIHGKPVTHLCAVSPSILPRPEDWHGQSYMTGTWFLDEGMDWTPDAPLTRFLEAGPPPIYVGFGSMPAKDPKAFTRTIIEGLRLAEQRAVLAQGWGALATDDLPDSLHLIEEAPHERLFPLMAAVVHHGGAGTTAASLRAGKPTLICPFAADQPFWGNRVRALGAGPPPLPARRLTAERFADAVRDLVTNSTYGDRARVLAGAIAHEDGLGRAVAIIEQGGEGLS